MSIFIYVHFLIFGQFCPKNISAFFSVPPLHHKLPTQKTKLFILPPTPCSKIGYFPRQFDVFSKLFWQK